MTVVSGVTLNFVDCASVLAFWVEKSKQWSVHDTRSVSNTFSFITDQLFQKYKKKYEPSKYESSHSTWYELEHQFSFEVIDNFSKVYVSVEDLAVRTCM